MVAGWVATWGASPWGGASFSWTVHTTPQMSRREPSPVPLPRTQREGPFLSLSCLGCPYSHLSLLSAVSDHYTSHSPHLATHKILAL